MKIILIALAIASLYGCAASALHYTDDHAIWLDRVKSGGF
jgi:hypothetical protein